MKPKLAAILDGAIEEGVKQDYNLHEVLSLESDRCD